MDPVTVHSVGTHAAKLGFKFTTVNAGFFKVYNQETGLGYQGNLVVIEAWLSGYERGAVHT